MGVKTLEHLHTYDKAKIGIYWVLMITIYVCYFLIFFGLYAGKPDFIQIVSLVFHSLICLFLLWRFHPFRTEYKLHPYDGNIIFGCAFILLINTYAVEVSSFLKNPKTYFTNLLSITSV